MAKYLDENGAEQLNQLLAAKFDTKKDKVLATKTYTGILGTANNTTWTQNSFYFGSVRPITFTDTWSIRYRIYVWVPSNANYRAMSECLFMGAQSNLASYAIFNNIFNTSYRPAYYHVMFRLLETGFNAGYGHAIGVSLRDSNTKDTSGYERNIKVEILETVNCAVTLLDTAIKWDVWPGKSTTNYSGANDTPPNYNFSSNGLQETGDANDTAYVLTTYYDRRVIGAGGVYGYNICTYDADEKMQGFVNSYSTGTSKTKNTATFRIGAPFYYYNSSTNKASGSYIGDNLLRLTTSTINLQYSTNCGTTLVAQKPVYLVGNPSGSTYTLADTWWTQTLPTTDDGKIYILLGTAYDTKSITWSIFHPVYWYKNNALQLYQIPITSSDVTTALGYTPYNSTNPNGYITNTGSTSGNAGTATKLQTSRTIAIGTGATGTATSFDGSANITIPITEMKEAYLKWGGKNIVNDVTPSDMGCIDEFGHNKLAYLPASCIDIAYSIDGGTTWVDYGWSDENKVKMVTTSSGGVSSGGSTTATADNITLLKLRIRLACGPVEGPCKLYTAAKKLLFNITNPGSGVKLNMRWRSIKNYVDDVDTWTTDSTTYDLGGGSGWNSIPWVHTFGGSMTTQTSQIGQIEFVFSNTQLGTWGSKKAIVFDIRMIGNTNWTMPSLMAKYGRVYDVDVSQNATFPGNIVPQNNNSKTLGTSSLKWNNVYATTFTGNLTGTATKATGDKNGNDITTTYYLASNPSGFGTYSKPSDGIPKTDLASAVQTSLVQALPSGTNINVWDLDTGVYKVDNGSNYFFYDNGDNTQKTQLNSEGILVVKNETSIVRYTLYKGKIIIKGTVDTFDSEDTTYEITTCQSVQNKVTSLSSGSTDTEYPSAKCVYDQLATKANVTKISGHTTSSDPLVLFNLNEGLYVLEKNCYFKYDNTEDPYNTSISAPSYLMVSKTSTTVASQTTYYISYTIFDGEGVIYGQISGKTSSNYTGSLNMTADFFTVAGKQNQVTASTTDLTPGTSSLATGELYVVYE